MDARPNIRLLNTTLTDHLNVDTDILGLLTAVEMSKTRAGADYAKLTIIDKDETMVANAWDLNLLNMNIVNASIGQVVKITGKPKTFGNNNLSYNCTGCTPVTDEELQTEYELTVTDFYNTVDNRAELANTLSLYLNSIADTVYGKITKQAVQNYWSVFNSVAAGKTVHHTAVGGLLLHTVEVIKVAETFYNMSVELGYDCLCKSLIIAGAIVHDIGKCKEIETSAVGSSEYTTHSILENHHLSGIVMLTEAATQLGLQNTAECAELCHMIAAHHEKQEWGQLKEPCMIEAVLVSKADYISATLNSTAKALNSAKPGEQYKAFGYGHNWVKSMGTYNNDINI